MNILIYFPYNQRTVEQQSVMEMFIKKGHHVFLLTLMPEGNLHRIASALGVACFSSNTGEKLSLKNIFSNARLLVRFCKAYKIDIIFAHQQVCALPLIIARPFLKCMSYYTRHNTEEGYSVNPIKAKLLNRFINNFSKRIITPSNVVFVFLRDIEKVSPQKLIRINYGYNFEQYEKPDFNIVTTIRDQYSTSLLIISVARLVEAKRHIKMFTVIRQLADAGVDCKFICLGSGHLLNELQAWIKNNKMGNHIFLLGNRSNVLDYLSAADLLLHLSETEASNSVVKEAGLAKKPVIVCERVGDFEDYIVHGQNGFLVNKEEPVNAVTAIITNYYTMPAELKEIGLNLQHTVLKQFDIANVSDDYDKIINRPQENE